MKNDFSEWAAVRFWTPPTWSFGFFARCALLQLGMTAPAMLLLQVGQGVVALVLFAALALLPQCRRLRVSRDALHLRYLFVEGTIPAGEIEGVFLEPDPRRGVLGKRQTVLHVRRRGGSRLLVFGAPETLRRLSAQLALL